MRVSRSVWALPALVAVVVCAQSPPYLDPSQPLDKRVDDLLGRLTIQEKTSLMGTTAPAIERLKIPVMNGWNQSLHGIVWTRPTTMFPVNISMAATWNPALIQEVAGAIADEGRAINNLWQSAPAASFDKDARGQLISVLANGERLGHNGLVYRSPVINISRDPRWGRIHEAFGEDPYLTSRMAVAYIKGTQGDNPKYLKLAATVKHFAVNNQESARMALSANVSERMLHEYFLPHFRAAIVEGKAQSIMSVYNSVNGVPGSANKLLVTDILRGLWGFDGFVVPDSTAVARAVSGHDLASTLEEAVAKSVRAGHDLDNVDFVPNVPKALEKGLLTQKDVDQAVRRILKVRFRLGEFDPPEMVPYARLPASEIGSPAHRQLALRTAQESIVLLTNKNNFLPLDRAKIKTVAVIGPHADRSFMGIGYTGQSAKFVKPVEGIRNTVAPGTQVLYARGSGILESDNPDAAAAEAVDAAKKADVAILFVGTDQLLEGEGKDRITINLPQIQQQLVQKVYAANPRTVVVLLNGGPVSVAWEKDNVPAVLEMFMAGEEGGNAIAGVLFGDYNPGARMPYTVYTAVTQVPAMDEYDITKGFTYMYLKSQPLYPFGHGLSYTTFQYSNLSLSAPQLRGDGQITVKVDVQNSGSRAGDEVVQLYVHDEEASVKRPAKELRGFERVSLKPGERRTVSFTLPAERLSFYDVNTKQFITEPGDFTVMVGSSSEDIRGTQKFKVTTAGAYKP
ncbi:MAG: glycoside hydrolase family 3 C-terminal domain-containing protein [Candidatus Solibacter sp.]